MTEKVRDAKKIYDRAKRRQEKMLSQIEDEVKDKNKKAKIIKKLNRIKNNEDRKKIEKEEKKMKFLARKYLNTGDIGETDEIKEILKECEGVKSLSIEYKIEKDNIEEEVRIVVMPDEEGMIVLSNEEKAALRLRPGFMINGEIKEVEIETELAVMFTKYRWEGRRFWMRIWEN